jgi:hypothetical protein
MLVFLPAEPFPEDRTSVGNAGMVDPVEEPEQFRPQALDHGLLRPEHGLASTLEAVVPHGRCPY